MSEVSELPLGPDGQPLIDHRGRSKPLYKPKRPRPESFRPSPWLTVVLDFIPGAWFITKKNKIVVGLSYLLAGVLALIPGIVALTGFHRMVGMVERLGFREYWILAYALIPLASASAFETLRLLALRGRRRKEPQPYARLLSALFLPSLLLVIGLPGIIDVEPAILRPLWYAGVILGVTATLGAARHILFDLGLTKDAQRIVLFSLGFALLVGAIALMLLNPASGLGALLT